MDHPLTITDVRGELKRASFTYKDRAATTALTLHWNGPAVAIPDLALLKADARFHVDTRGWDGLSYHYAVGQSGEAYLCRDPQTQLAHSGTRAGNDFSLAVLAIIGEGQEPSPAMLDTLSRLGTELADGWGFGYHRFVTHAEWGRATSCCGSRLTSWLRGWRAERTGLSSDTGVPFHLWALPGARIRDEPTTSSAELTKLIGGAPVLVVGKVSGQVVVGSSLWYRVVAGSVNGTGFMHSSVLRGGAGG